MSSRNPIDRTSADWREIDQEISAAQATRQSVRVRTPRPDVTRELGRYAGRGRGATLMVVCGVHGNEPAGVEAARRVFARLERGDIAFAGELVVFAGNLAGLRADVRYQAKDLNRVWTDAAVADLRTRTELDPEDREQLELLAVLESAQARARGRVYMADFHTTSASGIPFVLFGDTVSQREFVSGLPLPIIIGLEEQVEGVLSSYWTRRGCVSFTCEGGQHTDPNSVDNLEAVLWVTMALAGLVSGTAITEVRAAHQLLDSRRSDLPRVIEVVSRHAIHEQDLFKMQPGFRNIDHAAAGTLLAKDRNGEIRAEADGLVIMPLYQGLGSDGFFWGRSVSARRMRALNVLRKLRADRLLSLLPGVTRDPHDETKLHLSHNNADEAPMSLLAMFGYRRVRREAGHLTVERHDD
jgi:succinylglutamate desuccinylase